MHTNQSKPAHVFAACLMLLVLLLQVQSLPGGGSSAEYVLAVQPLFPIPAAVAPYTSGIFKQQVADLLEDVQAELDRQAGRQLED